jgi:co-chaperonin GroES (HSP10)
MNSMKNEAGLTLTWERVLVRMPKIERHSKGGIALPDVTYDKEQAGQCTGVCVDAAEAAWDHPAMDAVKRGDTVFFARYAGAGCEFAIGGVPYRVMNAADVIGVVHPDMSFDGQLRAARSSVETFGLNVAA